MVESTGCELSRMVERPTAIARRAVPVLCAVLCAKCCLCCAVLHCGGVAVCCTMLYSLRSTERGDRQGGFGASVIAVVGIEGFAVANVEGSRIANIEGLRS